MPCHVSGQDNAHKALAEGLKVVPREVLEEIVFSFVEQGEGLCRVEVLLHTLVAVANRSVRDLVDMVGVGEPIVSKVVANCTNDQ